MNHGEAFVITVKSFDIRVVTRPRVAPVSIFAQNSNYLHTRMLAPMEVVGNVVLDGQPGQDGRQWSIGFMQAISFVEWYIYRGDQEAHGSVLKQRGRPPAGKATTCVDANLAGTPFVLMQIDAPITLTNGRSLPPVLALPERPALPASLAVTLQDEPEGSQELVVSNTLTGQMNLMTEMRRYLDVCTVLALHGPGNRVLPIGGFQWSVGWQASVALDKLAGRVVVTPDLAGTRATTSPIFRGAPTDPRFAAIFTGPRGTTCNLEFEHEVKQEAQGWPKFNVSR